ncbi:MAG: hypothetical protein RDU30_17285 [Desulfovibrionaceae bacterium]|nr:hypothetical protein [Desulfovibrionaceae bacterium]
MNVTPAPRLRPQASALRFSLPVLLLLTVLALAGPALPARADSIPTPAALAPKLAAARDAQAMADAFLNIPYVDDATLDEQGRFTLFEHPEAVLPSPGLNCSGFTLSVSRFLLQKNIALAAATTDIGSDSGPGSPSGHDWDFGFDLIRNITRDLPRRAILPGGETPDLDAATGHGLRGFPIADTAAWTRVMARLRPGHVYLASISKPVKTKGYTLLHYHVGLIVPGRDGGFFFYHATPKSGSHRISLSAPGGVKQLQEQFRDKSPNEKRILLIETPLAVK